jgi:hypothetical protein
MAEIHYLISYNTETKKWIAADEALGAWFKDGPVWEGSHEDGKWRMLNYDDGMEMDTEYECSETMGKILKTLNGEG